MKSVFFDLDGTIVDSSEGIYASVQYAMTKLGRPSLAEKVLRSFIGPPLKDSFIKLGMTEAEAKQGVAFYRENYRQGAVLQVQVYDGMSELLQQLAANPQVKVYLATSKPEEFAKQILSHFQLAVYFDGIYGADMEGHRVAKADVLAYALANAGSVDRQQAWMIGDRQHDMVGALDNQVTPVGVLWGFGDQEELLSAGASGLVEQPSELRQLLGIA